MVQLIKIFNARGMWTRPMLEHRAILGRLRFINPDMINHFTSFITDLSILKKSKCLMAQLNTTTLQYLHPHAPFFWCRMERFSFWKIKIILFLTLKGNCIIWCNLLLNWGGSTSNLNLPFFKCILSHTLSILWCDYGNVNIFSQYVTLLLLLLYFWSVGDRKYMLNTVMLIYRYDRSSVLQ